MPDRGWITDAAKLQDAAGADGNGDTLDCRGWGAVGAQVTGTFVATVNFEGTIDGSTWVGIEGVNLADGSKAKSPTAPGVYVVPVTGLSSFRARVSGYASGSVTVLGRLSRDVGPALQDMDITTGAVTANIEGDYPEDSSHVSGERGLFVMGVRNDADAARTDADGDYSPVAVDSAGRPKVVGPLTDTQLRATAVPTNDPGLPDTLGQKAMAGSAGVAIASDQSAVPVDSELPAAAALADGAANPTAPTVGAAGLRWNGASLDRERGNTEVTVLASAARTATVDSADQTNHNARGAHVIIDVTAITATPSITPKIQVKDPASAKYYDVLVGVAITAVGTTVIKVYPGIAASANAAASDILGRTWRVRVEHADADSITYSVGAHVVV